ncbi:MAG: hypothetical protein EBX30_13510, partial [Betaproteobacteria bacterium]|nr:hypothetical protein [Betaproteobacteria bacterium]
LNFGVSKVWPCFSDLIRQPRHLAVARKNIFRNVANVINKPQVDDASTEAYIAMGVCEARRVRSVLTLAI